MKIPTLKPTLSVLRPTLPTIGRKSWRAGKTTNERGYTYRWQQYRKRFLFAHPLCVYCEREGRVELAEVVDHIRPHGGNDELFWNPENHQGLCKRHHDSQKQREERGTATPQAIGADGWPVDPGAAVGLSTPGAGGRTARGSKV